MYIVLVKNCHLLNCILEYLSGSEKDLLCRDGHYPSPIWRLMERVEAVAAYVVEVWTLMLWVCYVSVLACRWWLVVSWVLVCPTVDNLLFQCLILDIPKVCV